MITVMDQVKNKMLTERIEVELWSNITAQAQVQRVAVEVRLPEVVQQVRFLHISELQSFNKFS
jgi:hypothetical protein